MLGAAAALPAAGCASAVAGTEPDQTFTVVVLPDTQYYALRYPGILEAQIRWIARQRARAGIALVLHEGDIVDADTPDQWGRAASSLHGLDGVVPYLLSTGNHDYRRAGEDHIQRATSLDDYFAPLPTGGDVWESGTFEPGRLENSYLVLDLAGERWLVLSLEFGPRDRAVAWASSVLAQHAALPAIVLTHAYLDADGTRYDRAARRDEPWNPHRYFADDGPGAVNDGEELWRKLVAANDNVRFVLCGHALDDGTGRLTSLHDDGSPVHQLLANFQTGPLGGGGYLRLMRFAPRRRTVAVQTYSPYLDRWKRGPENQFDLGY